MRTIPDVPAQVHFRNLLDWLRPSVPEIDRLALRVFDTNHARMKDGQYVLRRESLGDLRSLYDLLDRLRSEGREWVNLCGEGQLGGGEYLIGVEYSQRTGAPATYVNLCGPPASMSGPPDPAARVDLK